MTSIRVVVAACASLFFSSPIGAQATAAAPSTPDTSPALTEDMRLLDRALLERARGTLERGGTTFLSYAAYVPDTAGAFPVIEIGENSFVDSRRGSVHRDSLRIAARKQQSYESSARTIGIITDSIAGAAEEAVDGADGPDFHRTAIIELEDRAGTCLRVERDYHFAKEPKGEWGFGTAVFDSARITACAPFGYWPAPKPDETPPARPRLAHPIVTPLQISSIGNYFSVVGRFSGKLTVYDDSIVVQFDSLLARRQFPKDPQRVRLDSIRVGVGVGDNETWSPVDDSQALRIARTLNGDTPVTRRNVRFVIRHERRESDPDSWIVVTFHVTSGRKGEPGYQPRATTYAHSSKGVLALDQ